MARGDDLQTQRKQAYNVLISLCVTYTICIFLMRVWIRRKQYGPDDLVALAAMGFTLAHFFIEYKSVSLGLGQSMVDLQQSSHLASLNESNRTGIVLFFISLWSSKGAAVAFISRFASRGLSRHWKVVFGTLGLLGLLGLASVLAMIINCKISSTTYFFDWRGDRSQCPSQYLRWQIVTAFDVFTEALILILPIDLIVSLQMPTSKKFWIITAFLTRLPSEISVVAFSFIHLHYIHILISADDPGLVSGSAFLWQEVEVAYSLAATTLLALRPFTREFNTGFGMGGETFRTHRTSKAGYMISSKENFGNSRGRGGSDGIELECRNHGSSKQGLASQMEAKTTTNVSHSSRNSSPKTDEISDVDAILVTHSHPSERDTF